MSGLRAQKTSDSGTYHPPLVFAKLIPKAFFSSRDFRVDLYGKAYAAYNRTIFQENRLGKSKKVFFCEFRYKGFEKYCIQNEIPYNINELKRFRRRSALSATLYAMAVTHPFAVASIYVYEPIKTNNRFLLPALISLYLVEWYATLKIKGDAERRLKKRVFLLN